MVDETLDWMDENPEADKEDYDEKQKEVEQVANPIMRKIYGAGGGGGAGATKTIWATLVMMSCSCTLGFDNC